MSLFNHIIKRYGNLPVSRASKGIGSFVTIDIGQTTTAPDPPLHIWVQYCKWTLFESGDAVLSSESRESDFDDVLARIVGSRLLSLDYDPSSAVQLTFSSDHRLVMVPDLSAYEPEDDMVTFFERDGDTTSVSPGRGVHVDAGGDPD